MSSVLEQFLTTLKGLPNDLQRSFATIQAIQTKIDVAQARLDELQTEMLTVANTPGPAQHKESIQILSELRQLQHLVYALHAEQVSLATQSRDVVYSYCRRADMDVKKLEAELPPEVLSADLSSRSKLAQGSFSTRREPCHHAVVTIFLLNEYTVIRSNAWYSIGDRDRGSSRPREAKGLTSDLARTNIATGFGISEPGDEAASGSGEVFCKCKKPSYGQMVGCDGPYCMYAGADGTGWFHYACVGLKKQPKGDWFCSPKCRADYERKNREGGGSSLKTRF
jgi:hypothetical protein